jgi:uncharacterized protein YhfF
MTHNTTTPRRSSSGVRGAPPGYTELCEGIAELKRDLVRQQESVVNVPKSVQPFWDKFQASIAYDASPLFYEAFHFDDNEPSANALAALVLSGQKRATAGLLWTNERTQKPLPKVGSLSVVTDWQGAPLCIIESTHIEVVPFDSVSDGFAALEGKGDKTLRYWREAHWRFFSRECQRIGREPDLHMPVVCEQFEVVYRACD